MPENRIIYKDIAPDAKADSTPTMDTAPFSSVDDLLLNGVSVPKVALLEDKYWKLDGTFNTFPNNPYEYSWGAWSQELCGADGVFLTSPTLTLELTQKHSSVGISFEFDIYDDCWCNDVNIKWYADGTLLTDINFQPNAVSYSCLQQVELFNKVIITFRSMNKPYRRLRIHSLEYGITRVFAHDEIKSGNVQMSVDLSSNAIEINEFDFVLQSDSDVAFLFQRKQPMTLYHGGKIKGVYYITGSSQTGINTWKINTADIISILDGIPDHGGMFVNVSAVDILTQILGVFPFTIEPELANVPLTGWLPVGTKRTNLQQICFALGATVNTCGNGEISIKNVPTEISQVFDRSKIFMGGSVQIGDIVTGVEIHEHSYVQNANTETQEIWKGDFEGSQFTVEFSEPYHSLTIENGTIIKSNCNYAVIAGTNDIILSGKQFEHFTKIVTIDNTNVGAGDTTNIAIIKEAYLVSRQNSFHVASWIYDLSQLRSKIKETVIIDDACPGDRVDTDTAFSGFYTGFLQSADVTIGNEWKASIVIVGAEKSVHDIDAEYLNDAYVGGWQ